MQYDMAELFGGSRWLMEPRAFRAMVQRAQRATPTQVDAAMAAYAARGQAAPQMVGDLALINVCGPITYKSSWLSMFFGGAAIEDLQAQFQTALDDPAVRTIAFRFDSPGGTVEMVPEFADVLFAARGAKPLIAVTDTLCASAAYWIAAQCQTIYASKSSRLGSIGVFREHDDISGLLEQAGVKITLIAHGDHKVDGNPYEALSDQARADLQAEVDSLGADFEAAVARGRGVTRRAVLETFGQGKVFTGPEAIGLGMADKAGTFLQVLGKLTKGRPTKVAAAALRPAPVALAAADPDEYESDDDETPVPCPDCLPECPCEGPTCPEDCPTCLPACACRAAAPMAAAVPEPVQAVADALTPADIDALAITLATGRDGRG